MDEQEKTEAPVLVGMISREELLGEGPEEVEFLQSLRPWQVKAKADVPDPPPGKKGARKGSRAA